MSKVVIVQTWPVCGDSFEYLSGLICHFRREVDSVQHTKCWRVCDLNDLYL